MYTACTTLSYQKTGSLTGKVIDIRTNTPVIRALVTLDDGILSNSTDSAGIFGYDSVPVGYHEIEVHVVGYETRIIPSISVTSGYNKGLVIRIRKNDAIIDLDKIVVSAPRMIEKKSEQSNSVTRLSREEILNSPGATQDPNKAIQILPSVSGDISPGWNTFLVRGGQEEENLFLIDGIEVNNLSHWGTEYGSGGAISYLHPDFIDALDFYAGGMPARIPPRLSSVMDISFRNGSMTDRNWQADLNIAGVGLFCEGPIVPGKASYIFNGRISFLDILEPLINAGGLPKYQNGQVKLSWNLNTANFLCLNFLAGHEAISIKEEEGNDQVHDEGIHAVGGLRWTYTSDAFRNEFLFSGKYNEFAEKGVSEDSIVYWRWDTDHSVFQLKNDFSLFVRTADIATFGFCAEWREQNDRIGSDTYYLYADTADTPSYRYFLHPPEAANLLALDTVGSEYDTSFTGYRIGGHASYLVRLGRFSLQAGVRDDYYTINRKHGFSPRGAVTFELQNGGELSLSSGLYYQFPAYVTRLAGYDDYLRLPLQRNVQAVFGYTQQIGDAILFGAETYYKYYDREPSYSIEQPDNAYPDAGYVSINASSNTHGRKDVYGLELYLHKKRLDRFFYQCAYTISSVKRLYTDGTWYDDDQNFRNSAKLIVGSSINRSNRLSLRLDVSEGNPYTKIHEAASMNNFGTMFDVSDGWNAKRRDPRINLSFRYDLAVNLKRISVTSYIEVDNILNRRGIVAEYYSLGDTYPEGEITRFPGRGILPIGGITISF
jgi:hypothetical protein